MGGSRAGRDQDDVFVGSEGDRWFERNVHTLAIVDPDTDRLLRVLDLYGIRPANVLEIGAANGYRLAALARNGARSVGVEPSKRAVADGRRRFVEVELHEGTADALPVEGPFDLVIINFVLHWVGRSRLFRVVAEADRVLADRGFLAIGDFYPRNLLRTPYHHLPGSGVQTFKQDYAKIFIASGAYEVIAVVTGSLGSGSLSADVEEKDRTAVTLLRKRQGSLHLEVSP